MIKKPLHPWLAFNRESYVEKICSGFREIVLSQLMRKGAIVAVSGGIDSSVCLALAVKALGAERVYALILPEKESSSTSRSLAETLCAHLKVPNEVTNIAPILQAIGCYRLRDEAIRSVLPDYTDGWKSKIVIARNILDSDRFNYFTLVAESPSGNRTEHRLPPAAYRQIVAATNFKQRIRKTLEYFHADRLHYAVTGTPNRLEYDQGFFVKNGDGSADIKPIAHLYKSQVYDLGCHLGLPDEICAASPTTDTYSLPQDQEEFYFAIPYQTLDLVLIGMNLGKTAGEVGEQVGLTEQQVGRVFLDLQRKRVTTRPLHLKPLLIEPVLEILP